MMSKLLGGEAISVEFRELKPHEAPALQAVYETVPAYYALFGGLRTDEAYKALTESPGVGDSHHAWGLFEGGELIGHLDFVLGYPESTTAYLGLLLVRGDRHGRGLGRAAFEQWLAWVMAGPFRRVRLGIVEGNESAFVFWERVGCRPTGERKALTINDRPVWVQIWELAF